MSYAPESPDLSSFYSGPTNPQDAGISSSGFGFPVVQASTAVSSSPRSRPPLSPPQIGSTPDATSNYQANRLSQGHFSSQSTQQQPHHLYAPYHELPYSPQTAVSQSQFNLAAANAQNHLQYPQALFQAQPNIQAHQIAPPPSHIINTSQTAPSPLGLQYIPPYTGQQYKTDPDAAYGFSPLQTNSQQSHTRSHSQPQLDTTQFKSEVKSEERYGVHSPRRIRIKSEYQPNYSLPEAMPPRRSAAAATAAQPSIMASPVKTRFPTARIKRIMQADEEVGKVAQQTPIAVGKALEMFMVALVSKSHDVAKDKGAKRVTAQHLKQVIESDEQWDFLREIVGRISETEEKAGRAGGRPKAESSSDDEAPEPKKKGRGGRKKKVV